MGVSNKDDIKKQLKQQNDQVYGDETVSGTMPDPESDDDIAESVEDVMGADAEKDIKEHKPFNIGEEVNEDEEDAAGWSIDDDEEE